MKNKQEEKQNKEPNFITRFLLNLGMKKKITPQVHTLPNDFVHYEPDINSGLSEDQVKDRIIHKLDNKDNQKTNKTTSQIILSNIFTFFNMLLLIVAIALLAFGQWNQCFFLIIAIINTTIGIVQEIKSKKTIEKLKLVTSQEINVLRDGVKKSISSEQLVLDDIFFLKSGDQIPSDSIVLNGSIEVNESLLTGESLPIKKKEGDKVLAGSFVVSGSCKAKAILIGDYNYASGLQAKAKEFHKPKSELLRSLNLIIKVIGILIIPLTIGNFVVNWFNIISNYILPDQWYEAAAETTKQVAGSTIGMIPSGMYLLTSIALSVGIINLAKKNTSVQDLYSIEMLARVNTLCLDKTGTLTDGTMKVDEVVIINKTIDMDKIVGSYLNAFNDSNQTSIALSQRFPLRHDYKVNRTIPFSSSRKYSAVEFLSEGTFILGAPEYLYKDKNQVILNYISVKQSQGYRVVMLCKSDRPISDKGEVVGRISPCAIFVLEDHIRNEAPSTIKWFVDNGVQIKIISGDNPLTASEIAKKCGVPEAEKCVSLEGLSLTEVAEIVDRYTVFGRVSPEQKAAIIKELKNRKRTVGMTGDGVNDILAMKNADCAIAMANGASAARNAAHLVLLDSNFSSMPAVVQEGRRVINNIQRSSSLFLMKTIFTVVLTLIVIFSSVTGHLMKYPFAPINLFLMETLGIGLPSFFLALQKNDALIEGHFLKNTFSRAIPAAICLLIAFIVNLTMSYTNNFLEINSSSPMDSLSFTTFSSYTLLIVSLAMVFNCCLPFNTYRSLMFGGLLVLALIGIFVLPYIPVPGNNKDLGMLLTGCSYSSLTKPMWLMLVIYGSVSLTFLNGIVAIYNRIKAVPKKAYQSKNAFNKKFELKFKDNDAKSVDNAVETKDSSRQD